MPYSSGCLWAFRIIHNDVYEHIETFTMIYLSFASLFGDELNIKGAVSVTKIKCDPVPVTRHLHGGLFVGN